MPAAQSTAPLAVRPGASTSTIPIGVPAQAVVPVASMQQPYQNGLATDSNPYRPLMNPNYSNPYHPQPPPQFPAHLRLNSASAPPLQPTQHNRPTLPPPVPSAPAVPRACKQPAILAPFTETRPNTSPQDLLNGPSAAPSWVHAPPQVPQLFTIPTTSKPATLGGITNGQMSSMRNDLHGPMTGLAASLTGAKYNAGYSIPTRAEMTERGPMLAPFNPSSASLHLQEQSKPAAIPSLNMLGGSNGTPPARKISDAQIVASPVAAARLKSHSPPSQASLTSTESTTSPHPFDDQNHSRRIRKKQKTTKAIATA